MEKENLKTPAKPSARAKILDAALSVIRAKGYSATTVDDLCATAGVAKGAFFHHFKSKDDLAVAAANYWSEMTGALFAGAAYHQPADPFDRVLAYLDFRIELLAGEIPDFTCLVGTMLQETYEQIPAIGAASYASIQSHARTLEADFEATIELYGRPDCPSAQSLALHTQTVIQGGFILAKGQGDAEIVRDSINHLQRYLCLLFNKPEEIRK